MFLQIKEKRKRVSLFFQDKPLSWKKMEKLFSKFPHSFDLAGKHVSLSFFILIIVLTKIPLTFHLIIIIPSIYSHLSFICSRSSPPPFSIHRLKALSSNASTTAINIAFNSSSSSRNNTSNIAFNSVVELAGHCCVREPYQRSDMGHVVDVLYSLVKEIYFTAFIFERVDNC